MKLHTRTELTPDLLNAMQITLFRISLALTLLFFTNASSFVLAQSEPLFDAAALFHDDRIIPIEIKLSEEDWDEIRYQTRDFAESFGKEMVESPFTWVPADITIDGKTIKEVGIRKKGFLGSLDTDRPSLKVRFDKYVEQSPVAGLTRMTLNNNKQDPARVLQHLSYKLFRESGTRAPRCGFASVTVNGNYLGIYSNVESIRKPMLEYNFGDGSGGLYEGTVADFFPGRTQKFERKNKAAKKKYLRKIADIFAEKQVDIDQVEEILDVDAFIRYWAMESLMGFWDSYCSNQNNFYIYRNPENDKFYFIPWGADSSFSRTTPLPPYRIRPRSVHAKAVIPNKLYRIPEVQQKYISTLKEILDQHWQEDELLAEVDRLETMLEPKVRDDEFQSTMDKYRSFIKTRRRSIMRELADGPPELQSREQTPVYMSVVGEATVSFSGKWYENAPANKDDLGEVSISYTEKGKKIEVTETSVYSEVSKWPNQGDRPPATVVIGFTRKSNGKRFTLAATLDQSEFKPTGEDTTGVGGVLIEGMNFQDMQMLSGEIQLKKASMEVGAPVSGELKVKVAKFKTGSPVENTDDDE